MEDYEEEAGGLRPTPENEANKTKILPCTAFVTTVLSLQCLRPFPPYKIIILKMPNFIYR